MTRAAPALTWSTAGGGLVVGHVTGDGPQVPSTVQTRRWFGTDPGGYGTATPTTATLRDDGAEIVVSALNEVPLYLVHDPERGSALVTTDLARAARVARDWQQAVDPADPTAYVDGATVLPSVRRLLPGTTLRLPAGAGGPLVEQRPAPSAAPAPAPADPVTAGDDLLRTLTRVVEHAVPRAPGRRRVAALLSGGVDSASVVTAAHRCGMEVVAYSVGTPWGDEHDDAGELCTHLGVTHVRVDLGVDALLDAVPEVIGWLGHAHPEKVDIGVIAMALLRSGRLAEETVLTGYGSDLINLGLPDPAADSDVQHARLLAGVEDARHSGELSDLHFRARGHRLRHPYWNPEVIAGALALSPAVKLHRGREKGHLRAAMARHVPPSVAWRRKVAVHQGGNLQRGLDLTLGGPEAKAAWYAACLREIVGATPAPGTAARPGVPVAG